jgi:hypothetical protein
MKLETTDAFSKRSATVLKEARTVRAAMEAGMKCEACSLPANVMSGGRFYCKLDAKVMRQRSQRAAMKGRRITRKEYDGGRSTTGW